MRTEEQKIVLARLIAQQLDIDDFTAATTKKLLGIYSSAYAQTLRQWEALDITATDLQRIRLIALLDELKKKVNELSIVIGEELAGAAGYTGEFVEKNIGNIISWDGQDPDFTNVSLGANQYRELALLEKIGDYTVVEWIESALLPEDTSVLIEKIAGGRVSGRGYDALLHDIVADMAGIDAIQRRNLDTVIKSYIQSAQSAAAESVFQANKNILKGVEWSAIMENASSSSGRGTCIRCQSLDGTVYKLDESRPDMPLHKKCRCQYVPITRTWKDLNIDIPENHNRYKHWYERDLTTREKLEHGFFDKDYAEWWKTKPPGWQDNAIGPVRANLVRDGFVKFDDLVDKKTGELILIKDLTKGIK